MSNEKLASGQEPFVVPINLGHSVRSTALGIRKDIASQRGVPRFFFAPHYAILRDSMAGQMSDVPQTCAQPFDSANHTNRWEPSSCLPGERGVVGHKRADVGLGNRRTPTEVFDQDHPYC